MHKICIKNNNYGMKWFITESVYSRGYILDDKGCYIAGRQFNKYLKNIKTEEELRKLLNDFTGNFAFVIKFSDQEIFAAVDRQRSFPILYLNNESDCFILDSMQEIPKELLTINEENLWQLSNTICVYNNKTVYNELFQVPPAHYLKVNNGKPTLVEYYKYSYQNNENISTEELLKRLTENYERIFQQLIKSLDNRMIALPLSGGRDSRLILFFLMKNGYKNIITYSYGYEGTDDQRISKQVADYFNVPYYYVHCNRYKMRKMSRKHLEKYLRYAGNACSLPCVQELYAVHYLKEKGIILDNCVFIPGHGGDFYNGARAFRLNGDNPEDLRNSFVKRIIYREYRVDKDNIEDSENIRKILSKEKICPDEKSFSNPEKASEVLERYYFKERESKYIQNCVRYYDYWGYDWCAPLLDFSLSKTWLSVPWEYRLERKFLDFWMELNYPLELRNIELAGKPKTSLTLKWCYGFVPTLDFFKFKLLKSYLNMNDFIYKKYERLIREDAK